MSLGLGLGLGLSAGAMLAAASVLDTVTGSAAAYALRRLRTAHAGPAIRVRRSGDSAPLDIGFTPLGGLDTAALLAHVGGDSGHIVTWYDQSGNGRNMAQALAARQPRIVINGVLQVAGTLPAIVCDSTVGNHHLVTPTWGAIAQPFSRNVVMRMPNVIVNNTHIMNTETGSPNVAEFINAGPIRMFAGVLNGPSASVSGNERLLYTAIYDGGASIIAKNGTPSSAAGLGSNSNAGISINRDDTGSLHGDFTYQEIVVFDRALSTPDRQFLERNQGAYYGIAVA